MAQSKSSGARTSSGTARKASSTARKGSGTTAKRSGSTQKRSGSANGKSRAKRSSSGGRAKPTSSSSSRARTPSAKGRSDSGVTGTMKVVAGKAKRPALAVGAAAAAAAAGILGGVAIKARTQPKKVLGVRVPRSASDLDAKTIAKAVGKASKQFAETTRGVSKDLDRAAEQAERIGRLLD